MKANVGYLLLKLLFHDKDDTFFIEMTHASFD